MGIFKDAEKGNEKHMQEVKRYLLEGEQVQQLFGLVTDWVAVTPIRLIFVNGSWSDTRNTITSIPFSRIQAVHLSKGGFMKFSKDVKVSISGHDFEMKFLDSENAMEMYNTILERIL